MLSSKVKVESLVSFNQTRPARSKTHMRPLGEKVTPTASSQLPPDGPGMIVSAKPTGTLAAAASPGPASQTNRASKKVQEIALAFEWSTERKLKGLVECRCGTNADLMVLPAGHKPTLK